MEFLENCYRKDPDTASREIADEIILVPVKRKLADVNAIYLLQDDVSVRIWKLIDGRKRVGEIVDTICKEFDGSGDEVQKDVEEFFIQLDKIGGIIQKVNKDSESVK